MMAAKIEAQYYPFQVRATETDMFNRMTIPAFTGLLQEAAWQHATELGASTHMLMEQGLSWALSKFSLSIKKLPAIAEKVEVETWPLGAGKYVAERGFNVRNEKNEIIATAMSYWIVINLSKRRIALMPDFIKALEVVLPDREVPAFENILLDEVALNRVEEVRVRWHDVDINHHVNNLIYFRWMLDALDFDFHKQHMLESMDIAFLAEANPSDILEIAHSATENDQEIFHKLTRPADAKVLATARTRWKATS